jgi:RNA polymerase sigma factor (sigma-70 family)
MNEQQITNEWITGFRRGDLQSVRELMVEYNSSLLQFAERIIRDSPEAREIVTETFIKLLNRRTWFDNPADIRAFLYITVRNGCMDFLKFSCNGQPREEKPLNSNESELDFDDAKVLHKANQILLTSLESLDQVGQQIFRCLFMEGMTTTAAARQLEMDQRELLNNRKKIVHQLQTALDENDLYSTPFFVHFLAVTCRTFTAEKISIL